MSMPVNKIILGTVQLGLDYGINNTSGKPSEQESFQILESAYNEGVRILDTATDYGNSHEIIGQFHKLSGKLFQVNTKFKMVQTHWKDAINSTLIDLKVDRLNCLFFHDFGEFSTVYLKKPSQLNTLKELPISKLGVSVYGNEQLEFAINSKCIDVIQLPFNLLDNWSKRGKLIRLAKQKKIEIQARSIFLQGLFFKRKDDLDDYFASLIPFLDQLQIIASKWEMSLNQMALNYVLRQECIDYVIIGVEKLDQLKQNLEIAKPVMPNEMMEELNNLHLPEELNKFLNPSQWEIK